MTTPEYPSFEDRSREPQPSQLVDRLSREDWPEFCRQAQAANELATDYQPGTKQTDKWLVAQVAELTKVFGQDYCNKPSQVLGLAYNEQHVRDAAADELIAVDAKSATFKSVDMQYVDGQWRVVLAFHVATSTALLPSGTYYIEPGSHLLEFAIDANFEDEDDEDDNQSPAAELLNQEALKAQRQITSKRFARRGPAEQRRMLDSIIINADLMIDPEQCNTSVVVDSLCYYMEFDDMPGIDLLDSYIDQTDLSLDERYAVVGVIHGFTYPELQHIGDDKLLTRKDFVYNDGAPCLKLRNDDLGRTYYIVPQSILDIT